MSYQRRNSFVNDIIIDIPSENIEDGKTLLIENCSELYIDGVHLSKPSKFIKHVHQLCLIDTQQQNNQSISSTHQLISDIDSKQVVQIIIEFPTEILINGKSIRIENNNNHLSEHIEDLFNHQTEKNIIIQVPNEYFQKGKTILIQNNQMKLIDTEIYQNEGKHHLTDNQFTKRDYLLSKKMMQMTIELLPEYFLEGQTVTFMKEDPQMIAANFPYHRQSRPSLPINNDLNSLN